MFIFLFIVIFLVVLCLVYRRLFLVFFIPFVLCYSCQATIATTGAIPDDASMRAFFSLIFSVLAAIPILGVLIAMGHK